MKLWHIIHPENVAVLVLAETNERARELGEAELLKETIRKIDHPLEVKLVFSDLTTETVAEVEDYGW